MQQHVEIGVKEGIRGDEACEGETRGTSQRLSGRRGGAARTVVAGAPSEAGVRGWRRTRPCAEDGGESAGSYSRAKRRGRGQSRIGHAKPKEAAHRLQYYCLKKFDGFLHQVQPRLGTSPISPIIVDFVFQCCTSLLVENSFVIQALGRSFLSIGEF